MPALRWKEAEIRALRTLAREQLLSGILPLILIDTIKEREQNAKRRGRSREPGVYLDEVADEMLQVLQEGRLVYVDTWLFERANDGMRGLERFFETLHGKQLASIPVLRTDAPPRRRRFFRDYDRKHGVAVRIRARHLLEVLDEIGSLLDDVGAAYSDSDLILDLWNMRAEFSDREFLERIAQVLELGPWRRATIIGGSYPAQLSRESKDNPTLVERREVAAFAAIKSGLSPSRKLIFGDYAFINPAAQPAASSGSAKRWPIIRYSTDAAWQVWRSDKPDQTGQLSGYVQLAQECATGASFMGRPFSPGDRCIEECARGEHLSPGDASAMITADLMHHIVYTMRQFSASLPRPQPLLRSACKPPSRHN